MTKAELIKAMEEMPYDATVIAEGDAGYYDIGVEYLPTENAILIFPDMD